MNMLVRLLLLVLALVHSGLRATAAKLETIEVASTVMHKPVHVCVILPESYLPAGPALPVLYLLHGWSGNHESWIKNLPDTVRLVDLYDFIVVTPDGGYSSWYFDSPIDKTSRYETFIGNELVEGIDARYHTVRARTGRAIAGLSMGGHGALYIAFKHQNVFGAAGSMSGAVDLRPFPLKWNIADRLGDYATHKQNWEENSVINLVNLLKPNSLALTIDCGTSDEFCPANRKLHEKLLARSIPHEYSERPGGHSLAYWQYSLPYLLLFFSQYFHGMRPI